MRTHKAQVDAQRAGMSQDQIRSANNEKRRQRRAARKAYFLALEAEREHRTPQKQLTALDFRLGKGQGAQKERARLQEKVKAFEEAEREAKKQRDKKMNQKK